MTSEMCSSQSRLAGKPTSLQSSLQCALVSVSFPRREEAAAAVAGSASEGKSDRCWWRIWFLCVFVQLFWSSRMVQCINYLSQGSQGSIWPSSWNEAVPQIRTSDTPGDAGGPTNLQCGRETLFRQSLFPKGFVSLLLFGSVCLLKFRVSEVHLFP